MSGPAVILPRLYCIVDAGAFANAPDPTAAAVAFARELTAGGATLLQYRNKSGNLRSMLADARELVRAVHSAHREAAPGVRPRLILNDRADLALLTGCDGVHVGQDDLSPEAARRVVSHAAQGNPLWVGVSTHSPEQVAAADDTSAEYIAVGPVYATVSKRNPDPVIGLDGVRRARQFTRKPLVAIGGITRQNCRAVIDAGADSVAVISDLAADPRRSVMEFLRLLAL